MKITTVAFVGAGYMAKEHIRAFSALADVRVVGITSRTQEKAQCLAREFSIPEVYESISAMYEKTKADLVVVTVPELAARDVLASVCEYPWTILAEKPVGYCVDDALAITAIAKERGRNILVALNRRFYGATQHVLSELNDTYEPRFVEVFDQQDPVAARNAGQPALVADNWMYANSVHVIDYFSVFCRGTVKRIDHIIPWDAARLGHVVACLHYDSGDVGTYHAIWDGPGPWACFVSTPHKRYEMRPLEQVQEQKRGERKLSPVPALPCDSDFKAGLYRQAEEAVKAVQGQPSLSVPLEEANRSMLLVKSIYQI